jgi:hypothetical protein
MGFLVIGQQAEDDLTTPPQHIWLLAIVQIGSYPVHLFSEIFGALI